MVHVAALLLPCAVLLPCVVSAGRISSEHSLLRTENKHAKESPGGGSGGGVVEPIAFEHRLRICNAYPNVAALDIFRYDRTNEKLTVHGAMPYNSCEDFRTKLQVGDKLEFQVENVNVGTFAVSDLPNNDAVLLLVIHRHDTLSTAVSFESHVFANLLNAQVAVIDTYKGSAKAVPHIMDAESQGKVARSEELRYNSVVAVNPGVYDVVLDVEDGRPEVKRPLVALNRESYVVIRTGVEAEKGPSFPQALVVYPHSSVEALGRERSAATATSASLLAPMLVLLAMTWRL